jgi:tetratricopeptide (TPR) repeat protein
MIKVGEQSAHFKAIRNQGTPSPVTTKPMVDRNLAEHPQRQVTESSKGVSKIQINDAPFRLISHPFIGRDIELNRIQDSLARNSTSESLRFIIAGSPGVGKTQLVLKYVHMVVEGDDTMNLFWLSGVSTDTIARGLENLLGLLSYKRKFAGFRQESRLQAARRRLEAFDQNEGRRWILVVDDVREGSGQMLARVLPRSGSNGAIIFTTRDERYIGDPPNPALTLHLTSYSEFAADDITSHHSSESAISPEARPLWIRDQPEAARMNEITNLVASSLKPSEVETNLSSLPLEQLANILAICWSRPTPESTLVLTSTHVLRKLEMKSPSAKVLLLLLAFFDLDNIPLGMFVHDLGTISWSGASPPTGTKISPISGVRRRSRVNSLTKGFRRIISKTTPPEISTQTPPKQSPILTGITSEDILQILRDPEMLEDAINTLSDSNLIGLRSGADLRAGRYDYIKIHEPLRESILEQLDMEDMKVYFHTAVTLVTGSLDAIGQALNDPTTWHACSKLVPHLQIMVRYCDRLDIRDAQLDLAYARLGWYFHTRGQYDEAEKCCKWAIDRLPEPNKSTIMEWLARVHIKQDKFDLAEIELRRLLPLSPRGKRILPEDKLIVAEGLATCLYLKGQLQEAEDLYLAILEKKNELPEGEDYQKAKIWEGLANTYQRLGRPDEAHQLYRRSLAYRKREFGSRYVQMLGTIYNQARLFRDQNKFQEAESLLLQVKHDLEELQGEDHPDVLLVSARLAYTYSRKGELEKGRSLALETLGKQESHETLQKVAISYTNWVLAGIYARLRHFSTAESYFGKALEGYTQDLSASHLFTLSVRRDMSDMYQKQSRLDDAIDILEEAIDHIQGSESAAKLARLYGHKGDLEKAQRLAEQTEKKQRDKLGKWNAEFNYTLWVLARIYALQGSLKNPNQFYGLAKHHYVWAFEGYERLPGNVFGHRSELATEIAVFLQSLSNDKEAQELLTDLTPRLLMSGWVKGQAGNEEWGPWRTPYDHPKEILGPDRAPPDSTYDEMWVIARTMSPEGVMQTYSTYARKEK